MPLMRSARWKRNLRTSSTSLWQVTMKSREPEPPMLLLGLNSVNTLWQSDPALLDALAEYWEGSLERVFSCTTEPGDGTWHVLFRKALDGVPTFYKTDPSTRAIDCIYASESPLIEAISLSRELITKAALLEGTVWLHASAFRISGRTFLVIGPKGAGKTTWLFVALLVAGAEFISNDQTPLDDVDGSLVVRRWRPDIKVRRPTLALLDESFTPAIDDSARLLWHATLGARRVLDIHAYARARGERLVALDGPPPRLADLGPHRVDAVIFIHPDGPVRVKPTSSKQAATLWRSLADDPDMFFPTDLQHWDSRHSFWRTRITGLAASRVSCARGIASMKHLQTRYPLYHANNRTALSEIRSFLGDFA